MTCDSCHGAGWTRSTTHLIGHGVNWPERCATCKGSGKLSNRQVAGALGVAPSTLKRIQNGKRCHKSTYERVLSAISDVLT